MDTNDLIKKNDYVAVHRRLNEDPDEVLVSLDEMKPLRFKEQTYLVAYLVNIKVQNLEKKAAAKKIYDRLLTFR